MNSALEYSTNKRGNESEETDGLAALPSPSELRRGSKTKSGGVRGMLRNNLSQELIKEDSDRTLLRGSSKSCRQNAVLLQNAGKKKGNKKKQQQQPQPQPKPLNTEAAMMQKKRNSTTSRKKRRDQQKPRKRQEDQQQQQQQGKNVAKEREHKEQNVQAHVKARDHKNTQATVVNKSRPNKQPKERDSQQLNKLADKLSSQRIRNGQCPTCGIQLYKVKVKGVFRRTLERKPISLDGQVKRGTCLLCTEKNDTVAAVIVSAMSSMIEDFDENKKTNGSSEDASSEQMKKPFKPADLTKQPSGDEDEEDLVAMYARLKQHNYSTGKFMREDMRRASMAEYACVPNTSVDTVYQGNFNANGNRDGQGELIWPNGDRYIGEFSRNARHGHGSLFFVDGGEYVGTWQNDKFHGAGTRRYGIGDVYTGEYAHGLREGEGQYFFENGDLYSGQFYNDSPHGFGRFYYKDGQCFEGFYVFGKREGKGKFQFENGEIDVQRYHEDKRTGEGVRWSVDRQSAFRLHDDSVRGPVTQMKAAQIVAQCDCDLWETMDD